MLIDVRLLLKILPPRAEHLPGGVHVNSRQIVVHAHIESDATHDALGDRIRRELQPFVALHELPGHVRSLGANLDQATEPFRVESLDWIRNPSVQS